MKRRSFVIGSTATVLAGAPARAQSVADFYRGKTVTCFIGYASGGGYDFYARMISRFMPRHIPGNPNIVAINMPGASSMTLGNHLARVAPKDGTVFGAVNSALVFDPLFHGNESKAQFKGPDMTMIGNAMVSAGVLFAMTRSGINSLEELKRDKELLVAATTPSGDTYILPVAMKNLLGLRLKIIIGYQGTRDVALALESGEVNGRVWDMEGIKASRPQWLREGTIKLLAQLAPRKDPAVPGDVPLARDFAASEDDRKALDVITLSTVLARPYLAPPDIPAERAQALRAAFMATMRDPEFIAEMGKANVNISPMTGEEMEQLIREAYALPEPLVLKVRQALVRN